MATRTLVETPVDTLCTDSENLWVTELLSTESHVRHPREVDARGQRCEYESVPYAGTWLGYPQSTGPTIPTHFMTSLYGEEGRGCEISM